MTTGNTNILPDAGKSGLFVGRAWVPAERAANGRAGPRVVAVRNGEIVDISRTFPTMSTLVNAPDRIECLQRDLPELDPIHCLYPAMDFLAGKC